MKVDRISVAEYQHLAHDDGFDVSEAIMVGGTWPISIGKHPDFPGAPILIGHVQDGAFLVTLDAVPEPAQETHLRFPLVQ